MSLACHRRLSLTDDERRRRDTSSISKKGCKMKKKEPFQKERGKKINKNEIYLRFRCMPRKSSSYFFPDTSHISGRKDDAV